MSYSQHRKMAQVMMLAGDRIHPNRQLECGVYWEEGIGGGGGKKGRDTETDKKTEIERGKAERERHIDRDRDREREREGGEGERGWDCLPQQEEGGREWAELVSYKDLWPVCKLDLLSLYRGVTVPGFQGVPGQ